MSASLRLGRVSNIPIGLHWSVLVFGLFASYNLAVNFLPVASPGGAAVWYLLASVVGVVGLAASVLAHELGHALVAQRNDVSVRAINLWALGGVAQLGSVPSTPGAALRISAAGPAVSLALAIGTGVPALLAGFASQTVGGLALPVTLLGYLAIVNLGLGLFNLLPALPLDGGRILQAALWRRSGDPDKATVSAASLGRFVGGAMILGGLWLTLTGNNGLWTMFLGLFIRGGATREGRHAQRSLHQRARAAAGDPIGPHWLTDLLTTEWPIATGTTVVDTASSPWSPSAGQQAAPDASTLVIDGTLAGSHDR